MATENDPILRSLSRSGGIPGSPLEKLVRQNAYKLVNGTDADDAALDAFIAIARKDEFFAESFTAPPAEAVTMSKATITPDKKQLSNMAISGNVPGSATPAKAKPQSQQTVQPTAEEFAEMRRSGKVAVGK
jgi:hypothetical protein